MDFFILFVVLKTFIARMVASTGGFAMFSLFFCTVFLNCIQLMIYKSGTIILKSTSINCSRFLRILHLYFDLDSCSPFQKP